ncbi:WD repeat-containing protein 38-like [Corticium candelabrum]|uniref:WD repeat-containing protein 38-like n=1 Tax=Corticium candelabrum TaxID=121492 RepID=UPI002E26A439|nr:WD repeat-containing protein 38-like [Corticium candelabrum]
MDATTSERAVGPISEGPLKLLHPIKFSCDVLCCALAQDQSYLAVGGADGQIRLFVVETGALVNCLSSPDDKQYGCVTSLQFRNKSHVLLATYSGGFVVHWQYNSGRILHELKEDRQTSCAAFSPDATHFATVGSESYVAIYNEATGALVRKLDASPSLTTMDGHRRRVFAVKYHPTRPDLLVSSGWDDTVQFWDVKSMTAVRHIFGVHVCGESLDIEPEKNKLLVGSWRWNDSLQVYDFDTTKLIKTFPLDKGRHSQLYCAKWLDQGMIACGGGTDNMARIIQTHNDQTQARVIKVPNAVVSQDYKMLASGHRIYVVTAGCMCFVYQHSFSKLIEAEE